VAGRLRRGEIRLVKFPPPDKQRPALVLTRDSGLSVLNRVTIAPITSTVRGIPTEVVLTPDDGMKATCAVNLDNVTTIARAGLGRRVAALGPERMREVCAALAFAVGCGG
jgi:mRNA interferase MazF